MQLYGFASLIVGVAGLSGGPAFASAGDGRLLLQAHGLRAEAVAVKGSAKSRRKAVVAVRGPATAKPSDDDVGMATLACDTDEDCDDGNACTTDACISNICVFTTIPDCRPCDTAEDCQDGDECTSEVCAEPGVCENPPAPAGTQCGDPTDAACDNPDTCDGSGLCLENLEPEDTVCRSAVDECDLAEVCTGVDAECPADGFVPAGSACGDPSDGDCDDPDTCDGAGDCQDNHEPDGTPCDDTLFCTLTDMCQAGACDGSGDPCGADEKCDEAEDACGPAATLEVQDLVVAPGQTGELLVSGSVANQGTFGVTILVEIRSREGNTGQVVFTPAPPVDIVQLGDPWPSQGLFSAFDTDSKGFWDTLNGTVDDDGEFLCDSLLDFAGPLAGFPVVASADAEGVWDVSLSTLDADSGWECVPTTLIPGTVTAGAAMEAHVDIRPGACPNPINTRSRGVLPVAIVGTEVVDVTMLDPATVVLSRADGVGGVVRPLVGGMGPRSVVQDVTGPALGIEPCECEFPGLPDGFDDLLLKFSVADLVDALGLATIDRGSSILLTLEGTLLDGTQFSGSDCVRILGPQSRRD